jgi:hypothetical protein
LKNSRQQSTNNNHDVDCFFVEQTTVDLQAHETVQIDVQYIATTMKRRDALLVFMNETIGEFVFLLEGSARKPE